MSKLTDAVVVTHRETGIGIPFPVFDSRFRVVRLTTCPNAGTHVYIEICGKPIRNIPVRESVAVLRWLLPDGFNIPVTVGGEE